MISSQLRLCWWKPSWSQVNIIKLLKKILFISN